MSTNAPLGDPVLRVRHLTVTYATAGGDVRAARDMSFELTRHEIVGIAGESGCGKSTVAHAICGLLHPPARIVEGEVRLGEVDLAVLRERDLRRVRWEQIAIVPQSAMNNLSPVLRVGEQIVDAIRAHRRQSVADAGRRARELLELVGVPGTHVASYPHELSGGMRQRAVIAMALALDPAVLVLDEPTTALDVMVQASILSTVRRLRETLDLAVVFITHDLPLLLQVVDRLLIMYAGRIVESGPARAVWEAPRHPYTAALLGAFPPLDGPRRRLAAIAGEPPNLRDASAGCAFAARCPAADAACRHERPPLESADGRAVACWHPVATKGGGSL